MFAMNRDMELWARNLLADIPLLKEGGSSVFYTAIFGGSDDLVNPSFPIDETDYICFTDRPEIESTIWKVVYIPCVYRDPRRTAKVFKLLPHIFLSNYEISIWIDGAIELKEESKLLLRILAKEQSIGVFEHPQRDCLYSEAAACFLHGRERATTVISQLLRYCVKGMPRHFGLFSGGVIIRRHRDQRAIEMMNLWAEQVDRYSVRDQISLPFVVWRSDFPIFIIPGVFWDNEFLRVNSHVRINMFSKSGKEERPLMLRLSKLALRVKHYFDR